MVFLSVVLTTFGRPQELIERINQYNSFIDSNLSIEIIVLDANNDRFKGVTEKFINYIWLPGKRGLANDYREAIKYASGEYVLFSTDDDVLELESLKGLYSELGKTDFLIIPHKIYDANYSSIGASRTTLHPYKKDMILGSMTCAELQHLSHIGSFVFKREMWKSEYELFDSQNYFPHIFPLFNSLNLLRTYNVSSCASLKIRLGAASWVSHTATVWLLHWWRVQEFIKSHHYRYQNLRSMRKLLVVAALTSKKDVLAAIRDRNGVSKSTVFFLNIFPQYLIDKLYHQYIKFKKDKVALYEFDSIKGLSKNTKRVL
jgi:glycosyltransferase involved in cell wall biosynthesis